MQWKYPGQKKWRTEVRHSRVSEILGYCWAIAPRVS
jgi:hypothetical protein